MGGGMVFRWVEAFRGTIPAGALPCGREADGQLLYACRARLQGGIHPGKIRPGFGGANIPWGGRECTVPEYEVLVLLDSDRE
jgi:hypothetical protein